MAIRLIIMSGAKMLDKTLFLVLVTVIILSAIGSCTYTVNQPNDLVCESMSFTDNKKELLLVDCNHSKDFISSPYIVRILFD